MAESRVMLKSQPSCLRFVVIYLRRLFLLRSSQVLSALSALAFPSVAKSLRVFSTASAFIGLPHSILADKKKQDNDKYCLPPATKLFQQRSRRGLASKMSDELAKAQEASPEEETIFDKIVRGIIPCQEVYSDDKVLAFRDVNPTAPVHILVIPKNRDGLSQLTKARPDQKELLGHLMYVGK